MLQGGKPYVYPSPSRFAIGDYVRIADADTLRGIQRCTVYTMFDAMIEDFAGRVCKVVSYCMLGHAVLNRPDMHCWPDEALSPAQSGDVYVHTPSWYDLQYNKKYSENAEVWPDEIVP
jgi:hypothetical protein